MCRIDPLIPVSGHSLTRVSKYYQYKKCGGEIYISPNVELQQINKYFLIKSHLGRCYSLKTNCSIIINLSDDAFGSCSTTLSHERVVLKILVVSFIRNSLQSYLFLCIANIVQSVNICDKIMTNEVMRKY